MTCRLCAAIAAGLPITDDTPLPCRARPTHHDPLPDDPGHGAVFHAQPGEPFSQAFVDAIHSHLTRTTPEERVAAHAPHVARATNYLTRNGLSEHPLDALTRKDP